MAASSALPTEDGQVPLGIDDLHFSLQAEQEDTQKKTFTCWINSQLAKHTPPSVISDLFSDIKKGHVLLDLLEVLSGQQLPRDKGSNTFQCRINIEHALTFLKNRSIKLINIHVADIVEGNPSIILGLIWTIILHFHIEELARMLSCDDNQPSLEVVSAADSSPTSSPPAKKSSKTQAQARWQLSAKKALLQWAQEQCATSESVSVTDFKSSWRNGMAFLAVIHALRPDLIDMDSVRHRSSKENLKEAFRIAEHELKIPKLLEPEDVDVVNPDEKSIMTYVAQFLKYSKDAPGPGASAQAKVKDAMAWLIVQEKKLQKMQEDSARDTYVNKYHSLLSFMESLNEEKEPFVDVLSLKGSMKELNEDQLQLRQAWASLTHQIAAWKAQLDDALPSPLRETEAWLKDVEGLVEEGLPTSQNYSEAVALIQGKMSLFKSLMGSSDYHSNTLLAFENRDENHLPVVPPDKLEEMKRRLNTILERKFILLLEFQASKYSVLALLDEAEAKLAVWNVTYGSEESVAVLLEDWRKFIEEEKFLAQLDTSFQKCEEMYKNLARECESVAEEYVTLEKKVHMCRQRIHNTKATLQRVLACWATYKEDLPLLKASFEATKKDQIKEVPFETLSQWNTKYTSLNEVGSFLIEVSSGEVGTSVSKELKRLNKIWRKFIPKTPLELRLPLTKIQDQPTGNNSGTILSEASAMPAEPHGSHDGDIRAVEKQEDEESTGQLKVNEEVEKLIKELRIWESETKSILDLLRHREGVDGSLVDTLQHLMTKGSMYEELLARTEDTLQMGVQNASNLESFQNILRAGLQAQIQAAKEGVQITMVELSAAWKGLSGESPEQDVKLKVEAAQKNLESYIARAQQLLGQRAHPGGLVSKYKEALEMFNTNSLARYLQAVEELKRSAPSDVRLRLEEQCRDACAKWEALRHEISLYIQQLKIAMEEGKLRDSIAKLEKQINKEKKLLRRGKARVLIQEHEACFSPGSVAHQLEQHMGVLRVLCEELTSPESQQELKRALGDYEQKIERLVKCASEIHGTLRSSHAGALKERGALTTTENGGRDAHSEALLETPENQPSTEKAMEPLKNFSQTPELKPQQEGSVVEKEGEHGSSLSDLQERYAAQREILERHLQDNKSRLMSDFPSESEWSSACLQGKLTDLQVLRADTDSCWHDFEVTSLNLESLVSDNEKPALAQARDLLKEKECTLQRLLNSRMESLEMALQIVLPLEKECALLCGPHPPLCTLVVRDLHPVEVDGTHQKLRDIRDSIAQQMRICANFEEPSGSVPRDLHTLDQRAIQGIVLKCRLQLETMDQKVEMSEAALEALEDFLASLRAVKFSAEPPADPLASNVQEGTPAVRTVEEDILLVTEKAGPLDERLRMLGINIKDAGGGENTTCEKLLGALSVKVSDSQSQSKQEGLTEDKVLLDACSSKNHELFKNIQDIQNQISKIGLKDPTAPAVKHRKKSLLRLDKDLDGLEEEKMRIQKMANSLPKFKDGREKMVIQQCQDTAALWDSAKASLSECLEQCASVLELLKQYQNFKNNLTALIQKEEGIISQQASYMGRDNLKKKVAEIETVKEEFNEHLEVVDKINQICKNLQYHLNKMKTFEESPFEKEANAIVDRWLDINEKTEEYGENLGRALALWDKLFNLKSSIDEWTEKVLGKLESQELTEDDRERLEEELKVHEEQASEFSRRMTDIQLLLHSNEKPLELQVMESSVLSKMRDVKRYVTGESNSCMPSGSTAELREDLDQAKTQMGMTESLLNALSPCDSLEIFTKLEEIQQQILQQKHSMAVLENQIGRLTPELSELKRQYASVSDLFNTKKSALLDHFSTFLNDQCKNFKDWFSNIKMNLRECFEPPETKLSVEQKLQKLSDFLTLGGGKSKIQQVQTVLQHVKMLLPKAHVKELSSCLGSQELELENMQSACQARARELSDSLQQLLRLDDDCRSLNKWLTNQEEKWKEMETSGEKTDLFYQALTRKREQFETVAQLNDSLKEHGLTEAEETIKEATHLMDRYQGLLRQLHEIEEEDKLPPAKDQSFNGLAHDVTHWIKEIKESLMALNSSEGKMPLEERIQKIKEIILLKPEGDAKIQTVMRQAEHCEAPLVQETLTDLSNQWDNTLHLANTYLSHQEKLVLEGEKYLQSKEGLRLMLRDLKKQQEAGLALQPGLPEKQAQLKICKKFLQKAQDLTSLLEELKSQGNYLLECTKNPSFSEEPWLEIKQLHESLLQQLQDSVRKLESHVQEHSSYQICITDLNTTLDDISKEFVSLCDASEEQIMVEDRMQKLQELESGLRFQGGALKKASALAKSIKQNTSSAGQKIIKDDIKSLKCKQKDLENRIESAKRETENGLNSILQSKGSTEKHTKFSLPGGDMLATSDVPEPTRESAAAGESEGTWETNKNSSVEMILSKQLSLNIQESMQNTQDERKVNELQNQPLELDIMLRNEQLKGMEELCAHLESRKAAIDLLEQSQRLSKTEGRALVLPTARSPAHCVGSLLQALLTLKKTKENQYGLLNSFQDQLVAAESSLNTFLAEAESLKAGSLDSAAYLGKLKKFLGSVEKEKGSLSKLRGEWAHLSSLLSAEDQNLVEGQMMQLELGWELVEQLTHRKCCQQATEHNEFTDLLKKAQDIGVSLHQQQQRLLPSLNSPEQQEGSLDMVAPAAELQAIKYELSGLKRQAELQMKRLWGEREKETLEDALNSLNNQLEALEPLSQEVENRVKKCDLKNRIKETLLWVKSMLAELNVPIALLPDSILSQIRKCKLIHDGILGKQQAVELLVEEARGITPSLAACESDGLSTLLESLQNQYQALLLKSTQRSQQLELKLEERNKLFAVIGKARLTLEESKSLVVPTREEASTEAHLEHRRAILKASQQQLREMESVISIHLQELTNAYKDANVFERLFLDDQLKNLKARTSQAQRCIQNNCNEIERKIKTHQEFLEKTAALQKEVESIQLGEHLPLHPEPQQDTKDQLCRIKNKLAAIQGDISQVLTSEEVFDCAGLHWDGSLLEQLQTQVFERERELELKIKQLDTFLTARDRYQALLSKMRALDLQIKKRAKSLLKVPNKSPKSTLLSAHILIQKIEKAKGLRDEVLKKLSKSEAFGDSFKEREMLQLKLNAEEHARLQEELQKMLLELQPKGVDEKAFQDKLENSLRVLKQVESRLQQPLCVHLGTQHIQDEKETWEALGEQVQAEMCGIRAVRVAEEQREENASRTSGVEAKLQDLEGLQMELSKSIDLRTNVLNDAYENATHYDETVTRAVGIITSLEAILLSYRADLHHPKTSLELAHCKLEELQSTVMDIQNLTETLGTISSPEAKEQLQGTLQELASKNTALKAVLEAQEAEDGRCLENYKCYRKMKEEICSRLRKMETDLGQSMSLLPKSYKEALARLDQSKALTASLLSIKGDLVTLRQVLRRLRCRESDGAACVLPVASALWERWLRLLEAARVWQRWSGELKREWKFISEEIEREAIILENLQEDLPEISKTKDTAPTEELCQLLDSLCQHEESVEKQQLLLALLLQRITNIQNIPEGTETVETIPAHQEIRSMQERCNRLLQATQKNKDVVQTEIQARHSLIKELTDAKHLFEQISTSFQILAQEGQPERAEQLEELQNGLQKGKLTFENTMEKLRIKYSEMYSIVPSEIESQVEECRKALEDANEKMSSEVSKSSPSRVMRRKIEEINKGLHGIEEMLQLKSKNIEEAQEIQKKIWDELDLWHSKLNELDSEVQDFVEQDPGQAQEWMDNLMAPFQQHQQVSQRAEFRTSQLNKATIKMEEYSDLLKNTEAWIEKISRLLSNPACYDSSRTLSHRASTLQMALEDSEQKYSLLHSVFTDLEDLSIIFETDDLIQSIQELSGQVAALQQQIVEALPHIQQVADDVVAIESEVKSMEKKVAKIKAILLSKEIFDFSPEEHLKHGEVILENIHPMKKTIAEIMTYQVELRPPQTGTKPLPVFQRTNQLLQDVKLLENVTQEQNELLKVVIKQTAECDGEIENLKQILNNYSAEFSPGHASQKQVADLPSLQGEMEGLEEQVLNLTQKKEDLLVGLKAAVLNLHEHLKQEQQEAEGDELSSGPSEEGGAAERGTSDRKLNRASSMSFLPVVKEEAEESSVKSEDGRQRAEPPSASWSLPWKHSKDLEEDGASSSSATIVQEADGRISTCDSSMAHMIAPDSGSTEQGPEPSPKLSQAEEGATPSTEAAPLDFPHEQGAFEATVERSGPQPSEVLHACKTQVAELELWLQQACVAFEPEALGTDMQQVVEQELAGCQAMLTEIENKVASLLDTCKDQGLEDCGATQQEAEALSWKLKTVKCNLEKVQMMLQEKYSEDQHPTPLKLLSEPDPVLQSASLSELGSVLTEMPQFSKQKDVPQAQAVELKPLEQKDLIKFTEFNAKKTWLQYCQQDKDANQLSASSSKVPSSGNAAPDSALPPQDQSGDKWQYLHHELTSRPNSPGPQLVEPQVVTNTSTLPSVSEYNFRCPTADELQTYTTQLEDLRQEANSLQTQESMTEETYANLDKRLFELFLSLSRCLGSVEELLQRPRLLREDASAQQALFEKLALELKKLYLALGDKTDDLLKAVTWPGKNTTLLSGCFRALKVSLERTQAKAAWRSSSLKAGLDHSRSYQNEIKRLYNQLVKKKMALQQSLNEISGQSIDEQLQKADVHTAELQNSERQVAKLRNEGERLRFPHVLLQDVYKLEDVLDSMWGILRAKYLELSSPLLSKSQQDALLQGMAELVNIGKEKLATGPLQLVKSKVALQAQLQDHKGFFRKLVADMLLIQTYSAKMFPRSLQKGEVFGAEQVAAVKALEEEACLKGSQLQSLLEKWEEFDDNYASLEKDLEVLISSLPSVSLVEETEERLLERISFYQQIKRNIDGKHVRLCQTLSSGKQLAASVSCPELEGQITKLEEQWLSLNKKIDHELHRLQTLLKHLLSYSRDSDELTRWLESSQQTLNYWKERSLNVSQDLDTIRSNIDSFFEFSKEVDEKSSLKSAVLSTGNQLLHLKESDTATLRASLAQFEQKWTTLITQLPDIQEKLHQLQMEKLPSRNAIREMICWMNAMEPQAAGEDAELSQHSASQVKNLLQKLKGFRMEMDYKQWIVDFVNQSLLQLSTCDVESKRYERTEFAEHLGEMNRQWHRTHGALSRKIQHLEQLLESITENENKIQNLNSWLKAQEEKLKILQKPESAISMEKLLLDCQDIENQLAVKSKALDELRQSPLTLEGGDMLLLEDMASRIDELFQKKSDVTSQVHQLRASVQSVLQDWKAYDKLYDEANVMTIQLAYSMEHSKPVVLSVEALDCQVQNLQALQDEAESREGSWEKLQDVVGRLKDSCPSIAGIMEEKCQDVHSRWTQVNQDLADQLQEARGQLQLWKASHSAHTEATAWLQQQEAKFQQLANINMSGNNLADILPLALQDIKELQRDVLKTKEAFLENSTLLDQLPPPEDRSTPGLHSGQLHSLQTAAYLEKMLLVKSNEFEIVLAQFKDFGDRLEYLKDLIMHEEENLNKLYHEEKEEVPGSFLNHVLALTAQSPDIERLNEESLRLPLSDITIKTLQSVNRQWIRVTATALDHCSKLQGTGLNENFLHHCENWIHLLEKIEEALTETIAHSLPALLEQQKTYEMLEAEVSVSQTVADAYVAQSLQLLDSTETEKRPEYVSEVSKLSDQWQNAARGVQQRKRDVDRLVTQWRFFTTSVEDLLRFLTDTGHLLSAVREQDCYSLCQTRRLIHELKNKEIHVQRWRTTYELALEAGEKLRDTPNPETKEFIDGQTSKLQDTWKDTELSLGEMISQLQNTAETWDQCEKKIEELKSGLQVLNTQSRAPLPELHKDLHREKGLTKEVEKSLANWTHNLEELQTMKADLSRRILAEDVTVLKEQIELLHRQWEDLCLRVAIRKQEIEDRLNSWIVFNEKNKELCAWLVQMENKVLQTADISIEEMIDKLQKDCMEEISLFSENKLQLKQMGDQLIKASSKAKAAEMEDKLSKINDRWQHLFDVIGSRVKKLKETFAFIQQLDKNMSNLRTWLARIESELSKPVVYDVCDDQEIQKRLAEQQDLQRDIEQHSAGVESVFSICDVLLHDSDACANETECDSIQQTTRSLDRRWRNICAMSMERRMKIEETWRLWQKFLDDYSRFEDWLKSAERTAACPNSSEVLYTNAKEELKRFEAFQRQIHERLTQLELINKQYRRLARENRTDTASKLKQMVHEGNQRWDNLQKRVTAILRRLRYFTNQREEFEGTRESILVWLTEMDLQLTNVEHFSESDAEDKMRQLNGFQQEITLNTNKIDQLIVFGEQLIQKSEPLDAVLIEDELEELHRYCQEVFGRVSRFHRRLTSHAPSLEDEKEASENETDIEDPREIQADSWRKRREIEEPSCPQSLCHLVPPALGHERSGCETPVSVDSIPLEWDHTGDVGGSSSHEDDEEGPFYSALSDVEIPENPEAYLKMTTKSLKASSGKSISEGHSWHVPDNPSHPKHHYKAMEGDRTVAPVPSDASTPYKPAYVKLLLRQGTDDGKEGTRGSKGSRQQEDEQLDTLTGQQPGAFDRWELIQAQELHGKLRMKENVQQLNSDIGNITAWLEKTEAELETLRLAEPPSDIQEMALRVKRLQEILKAFDTYKTFMVSVSESHKESLPNESPESTELQNRLHQLSLSWDTVQGVMDSWRADLRQSLMQCQDFHQLSHDLLLWLASVESRRQKACITSPEADRQALLEAHKELTQLEQELEDRQAQVSSLQEIASSLLVKGHGEDYIEAEEKVHVIGKKLKQLREQVARDLMSLQGSLNPDPSLASFDEVDSGEQPLAASAPASYAKFGAERSAEEEEETDSRLPHLDGPGSSQPRRSFLSRVIRAALPLQLLLLLLLLLACLLPASEEDYSCTQANNFARSFYPMLRYTNGPPPT
ncbi:nesprin-2 isoform X2 [Mesocricetus auratus]|uniref:Nesprin-2 isoform X2 n=1 Tax=Mesocricetus auratus TaxID=10036 RepID=A0ABM2X7J9_MESAU|nr:nesprin-2 isoform X2 [Mesocricetus auratus]